MVVTGTLTPDSWVSLLHQVSVFPDKYSVDKNTRSPKFMPRLCQVLDKSLVLGKNTVPLSSGLLGLREGGKASIPEKARSFSSSLFGGEFQNIQL